MSVEAFQDLKRRMDSTNADIARLRGVQGEKQKQLDAILARHGCKSIDELEALSRKVEQEALALEQEVQSYLTESGKAIQELNTLLTGG